MVVFIPPNDKTDQGNVIRHIESGLAAIITPGLELAFQDRLYIHFCGQIPSGAWARRSIPVCGPAAFTAHKALAFGSRTENKDAYDLLYVWNGVGVADVEKSLVSLLPAANVDRALATIGQVPWERRISSSEGLQMTFKRMWSARRRHFSVICPGYNSHVCPESIRIGNKSSGVVADRRTAPGSPRPTPTLERHPSPTTTAVQTLGCLGVLVVQNDGLLSKADRQEQLSKAYAHAIAARAGYTTAVFDPDRSGIDMQVRAGGWRNPSLDLQLKATINLRPRINRSEFSFRLKKSNYNQLREESQTPRLLVVLDMPTDEQEWMTLADDELILRHRAYWLNLNGKPPATRGLETVYIPKNQVFDVEGINHLMDESRHGRL